MKTVEAPAACVWPGCARSSLDDLLVRVSPPGNDFAGMCPEHAGLPYPPLPEGRWCTSRLTLALNVAGLEGAACDRALGVAGPRGQDLCVVDWWETGRVVPTPLELLILAHRTGRTPEFFFGPPLEVSGSVFLCGRGSQTRGRMVIDPDTGITHMI